MSIVCDCRKVVLPGRSCGIWDEIGCVVTVGVITEVLMDHARQGREEWCIERFPDRFTWILWNFVSFLMVVFAEVWQLHLAW